jgi:hypothetical protein
MLPGGDLSKVGPPSLLSTVFQPLEGIQIPAVVDAEAV